MELLFLEAMPNNPVTREEFDELKTMVTEVHSAIVGCEDIGHKGLVRRMRDLEVWKDSMVVKITLVTGLVTGAGFVIRFIITGHM
jgi:hypothetical protein